MFLMLSATYVWNFYRTVFTIALTIRSVEGSLSRSLFTRLILFGHLSEFGEQHCY